LANCLHFDAPVGQETAYSSFEAYAKFFEKTYTTKHAKIHAYKNYILSFKRISEKNKAQNITVYGLTKFADMSPKEFKQRILMKPLDENYVRKVQGPNVQNPSNPIDWVAKGATTPVKNQAMCGSCWCFSATETVESANLIAKKISRNTWLAPQEIVDCDTEGSGCNGGWPNQAMNWIISQGGQDTESSYPYTGQDGTCASSSGTIGATIKTVVPVSQSESAMYSALHKMPLSICADAEPWQDYSGGILTAAECGSSIDHAIQLTGYNPTQGGYWIVRNSWGANWGISGFIWLQYGQDTCGITSYTNYATV